MLTVKKSNHKIRSRDLLLSLMCYAFMCSGSENYNRNRKCRKCLHNLSHGCRCASWQTFWQLYYFTTFYFLSKLLISARPQRQTNAKGCRIFGDLDQLKSKNTMQKTVDWSPRRREEKKYNSNEIKLYIVLVLFHFWLRWLTWLYWKRSVVSLYRAGEEKPIERYKTRVKVAEENKLFLSFQKKYYRVSWAQPASSKVRLRVCRS